MKEPLCCWKFLKDGKCDYEATTGKACGFPHFTEAEKAKKTKLLKEQLKAEG